MNKTVIAGAAALIAALAGGAANADVISFNLTTGNQAISGFTGPYANVSVNLTAPTLATITFTSLTNSGNIYLLGDGGSVAVNVNAASWTLGSISGSNAGTGFTPGPYSDGGSGNEDGFGSFNQTINSFDGYTHSSDTISFTLTDTSGTWANAAAVLTNNTGGAAAGAHIFVTTSPADAANGAIVTGFAAGVETGFPPPPPPPPPGVPEPASIALLGIGLLGLGVVGTRRRR